MTGTKFKRKWFWIVVPLVVAIAVAAIAILTPAGEPRHDGKLLSFWVDQLPVTIASGSIVTVADKMSISGKFGQMQTQPTPGMGAEAMKAIGELGEKCLPYLIARLQTRDPVWKIECSVWAMKLGLTKVPWRQNNILTAGQADTALELLGNRAQTAIPALLKLTNDKDPSIRDQARHVLKTLTKPPPKRNSA